MPRSIAALILVLLPLLAAVPSAAEDKPIADPPPGQLLIASAGMRDPRFHQSVILLFAHDNRGAFGLIINRPIGERPLASLLTDGERRDGTNRNAAGIAGTIRIFFGGPVQPELGFVIHGTDYSRPETLTVGDTAMTANKEILRDIGQGKGPARYLFALGYAGWGAGQVENEFQVNGWIHCQADPALVFGTDPQAKWSAALARLGIGPSGLVSDAGRA